MLVGVELPNDKYSLVASGNEIVAWRISILRRREKREVEEEMRGKRSKE